MALQAGHPSRFACVALLLSTLIAACTTPSPPRRVQRSAEEVRTQLESLLPSRLADRRGWARDIQLAFEHLDLLPSTENLCAALAVTEQESGFVVDPEVPGLGRIARTELERRAERHHVPHLLLRAALALESPDGRSYARRIEALRTEKQMSELFEDLISTVPLGQRLFADANPVRSGGPMQVRIDFAERHVHEQGYPWPLERSIRHEVFSRRGGMYFGIAHLLAYRNSYTRHLHRFADFNAGWYASRNAAFQAAVARLDGNALVLDGDLILHPSKADEPGATERAVRRLGPALDLDARAIRRALELGNQAEFERTALWQKVFALAERRTGTPMPRAIVPQIRLHSPKITRPLTTAWFAERVQTRYQRCVNRAFGRAS